MTSPRTLAIVPLLLIVAADLSGPGAQRVRRVTDFVPWGFTRAAVDDSGSRVVTWWRGDPLGTNPSRVYRLVVWDRDAQTVTQLDPFIRSSFPGSTSHPLSITDDGEWIAVVDDADPVGANGDGSQEIFLVSADGLTIEQVTSFPAGTTGITSMSISGQGNRLAYGGSLDPSGANPDSHGGVYTIGADGTGSRIVVVGASGDLLGLSISDDGERLVFVHDGDLGTGVSNGSPKLYRSLWNRVEFRQLAGGADVRRAAISGDGQSILHGDGPLTVTDWEETQSTVVGPADISSEAISDDGQWVFYTTFTVAGPAPGQLFKVPLAGGSPAALTEPLPRTLMSDLRLAGNGVRAVFRLQRGSIQGIDNADGSSEMVVVDADGGSPLRLTDNGHDGSVWEPDISADGTRAVFSLGSHLFAVEPDGFGLRLLTLGTGVESPALSGDAEQVAAVLFDDLDGTNACSGIQHLVFRVPLAATGPIQLSPVGSCNPTRAYTDVAHDTGLVVFQSTEAPPAELMAIPLGGGAPVQLTADGDDLRKNPRVSADGAWVVYHSDADVIPGSVAQVFRVPTDGSLASEPVTLDFGQPSLLPDVSADGSRVAYESQADPLGANPDHNREIFLHDFDTDTTVQLTETTTGGCQEPRISGNGQWVYFVSDSGFFDQAGSNLYRVEVASGKLERAQGLATGGFYAAGLRYRPVFSVDHSGDRAALAAVSSPTGEPTLSGQQLYFIEFDVAPRFTISSGAPTTLEWEADPRYLSYDVIRGAVANLAQGAGGEVDLGPVVCIASGSANAAEDPTQPGIGQTFFYLYRGRVGSVLPADGWGTSSSGETRVPSSGGCPN